MGEELVNPDPAHRKPIPPEPQANPCTEGERKRPRPRWWQKLALVSFSFVLLLIAELALRLVGYGPTLDFVVNRLDRGSERIMGINPHAYQRFHGALGPATERTRFAPWREFLDPKPPNHFRVMFLGESTIEGYPHPPNGCAPAFLEAMLQDVWPDRHVEVINCGVTAINSWSIRAWAAEVLRYEPDLLLLYAGHNEFYGGYGPASLNAAGTNRSRVLAQIWLSDLRFVRALSDGIGALRPRSTAPRGTLMERLAREQQIPLDSALYTGCRDNFRTNLEDIARAARGANVPLLLCGLVSNEKDLVPMSSVHRGDLSAEQRQTWKDHFSAGLAAARTLRWTEAIDSFQEAARIDDSHAELVYRLAEAHEGIGQYDRARELYRRARDLDALRFRATAEFSEVIREVAERNHALFVDVLAAFESASPHGLIGWNLMTDHLHPTLFGHYLMARAICETMARDHRSWPAVDTARLPLYDALAERLGNDELSEMVSKITVYRLAGGFPYANSPNAALHERLESEILAWQVRVTGPMAIGHRNWSSTPSWDTLHYHVGRAYLDAGDARQAIAYFRRAEQMSEPHSLPAARAKCGLACAWLASPIQDERAAGRAYAAELRSWLQDARAMHPKELERFTRLEDELDRALGDTSH
jgi:lysophospholipase L1-like esterase